MSSPGKLSDWICWRRNRLPVLNRGSASEIPVLKSLLHINETCRYDQCPCGSTALEILKNSEYDPARRVARTYMQYLTGEFTQMEYPVLAFGFFIRQNPHLLKTSKSQFQRIVSFFYRHNKLLIPTAVSMLQDDIARQFRTDAGLAARDQAWSDLQHARRHMHCSGCKTTSTGPDMILTSPSASNDERCVLGYLQTLINPFAFSRWPEWLTEADRLTPVQKAILFAYAKKWHRVLRHFPALQMLLQLVDAVTIYPFHWDILFNVARCELIETERARACPPCPPVTTHKMLSLAARIPDLLYEHEIAQKLSEEETRQAALWKRRYWKSDDFKPVKGKK